MNTTDEHDRLQMYTIGRLLLQNTGGDDIQGSWTFDTSGLARAGMLCRLGMVGVEGVGASSSNASEQT